MFDRRLLANFDWILCIVVLLICSIGVLAIHSATIGAEAKEMYRDRQIIWIMGGIVVALATTLVDYRTIAKWGYFAHFVVIMLLVLVLLIGTGGPGSPVERWIKVGPFFIQPSEFAKFTMILALAHHFRESHRIGDIGLIGLFWPLMLMAVPFVLILRQPDLGTGMLLVFGFFPMIFMAGLRKITMFLIGVLSLVSIPLAWSFVLKPYQKDRVMTLINPDRDPLGTGYHVLQSKIAVGSGGLWGKGFEQGTQATLNFLPAHHTDFIFAVFSEEWGFVGAVVVLVLFLFLILWSLSNVLKIKERTSSILTVGVVSMIAAQVLVNIGMAIGLMPVVGVPLPFFSYGGSSMLSKMFGIGLLLNIRMRRFEVQ